VRGWPELDLRLVDLRPPGDEAKDPARRGALVTLRVVVPVEEAEGQRVGKSGAGDRAASSAIRGLPVARAWRNRA
jgi:hypothetical protein